MVRFSFAIGFIIFALTEFDTMAFNRIAIVGAGQMSSAKTKTLNFDSDGVGICAGVLVESNRGSGGGPEFGVILNHKKMKSTFTYGSSKVNLSVDEMRVEVPILYRYWLATEFGIGGGVYFSRDMSVTTKGENASSKSPVLLSSPLPKGDAGFVASAVFVHRIGNDTHLVGDLRYQYGIQSQATTNEVRLLAGLRFNL